MPGHFSITPEIIDQIIFGMENQKEDMILDAETGLVIPAASVPEEERSQERYYDLPVWGPIDGFQLMEGFAGALRNPIYRERLRQILSSGRGVFRGFKNVLKERPDLEKKWFLYKERFMKQRAREWYNDLCGYWDVLDTGEEPAEIEDLFLEDFRIVPVYGDDPDVQENRQAYFKEIYHSYPENLRDILISQAEWRMRGPDFILKSLTPSGGTAGILCGFIEEKGGEAFLFLDTLYVLPEFRGAGIASGLMDQAAESAYDRGIRRMMISLCPEGNILGENFKRRGFRPFSTTLEQDLQEWYRENVRTLE